MKQTKLQISAFTLHLIAMSAMLLDHLWATVVPGNLWMNLVGRIAFPIFAFLTVEGFFHTHNLNRYLLRLFLFALLSEIPYNLMQGGTLLQPFAQNVLWTLLLGLLAVRGMEAIRQYHKPWLRAAVVFGLSLCGFLLGFLGFTDYYGVGVLTVILFYIFHGHRWYHLCGQVIGLYILHILLLGGEDLVLSLFGTKLYLSVQGFSLLALIPIWLYRGRQGPHSKVIQYSCYAFYPLHMLVLSLLALA